MPVHKRATNPSQCAKLHDLLNLFPCPAWIEDVSGRILARNAHFTGSAGIPPAKQEREVVRPAIAGRDARAPVQTVAFPLPPAGGTKELRLVALFPAGQESDCQCRIISALLAKTLRARQTSVVDVPSEARSLTALLASLTPQQRTIYREITPGCSFKEIAARLGISHGNLLFQIHGMRKKLGVELLPYQRKKRRRFAN